MPMKLNCGFSRKIGEPHYGSRGASVNVEVELDASLVREPKELRNKIRYLFYLARKEVDHELKTPTTAAATNGAALPPAPQRNGSG